MSSSGRVMDLILVGIGGVGRCLVQQVLASRSYHASHYGLSFRIAALCDSTGAVLTEQKGSSLSEDVINSVLSWKKEGKPLAEHAHGKKQTTDQVVSSLSDNHSCVVDCSAASAPTMIPLFLTQLSRGGGIALANKKPLTGDWELYQSLHTLQYWSRVRNESTVGAGTPIIATLNRLLAANDTITRIQGTMSGTLGFLVTGLEAGTPYSQVVQQAFDLGYTEPDPRDDLGGVDVARKALILARSLGWPLSMSDISIEPLFPPSFANLAVPDFLKALPQLDEEYSKRCEDAHKQGKVLRYVANIQEQKITVALQALDKNTPIGRLSGTENMVEFYTRWYNPKPLVVQGSGAGGDITAAGVLADLVELAQLIHYTRPQFPTA